jgi:Ohr subfamily peroxiredoxin
MSLLENESTTPASDKVIYTAKVHTTGGRKDGVARSSDGRLDVKLSLPGSTRVGTNPEQLFAAGWSACFESAIAIVAQARKIAVSEVTIDAEVDLHQADNEHFISARFNVGVPGVSREIAESLVKQAEQLCTYSKATRGNVEAVFNVV